MYYISKMVDTFLGFLLILIVFLGLSLLFILFLPIVVLSLLLGLPLYILFLIFYRGEKDDNNKDRGCSSGNDII